MTRDDIIRMARSAFDVHTDERGRETFSGDHWCVEELAALVAAEKDKQIADLLRAAELCLPCMSLLNSAYEVSSFHMLREAVVNAKGSVLPLHILRNIGTTKTGAIRARGEK